MNEAEKQMLPSTGMLHQWGTTALPHGAAETQVSGLEASSLHPPQQEMLDFAVSLKNWSQHFPGLLAPSERKPVIHQNSSATDMLSTATLKIHLSYAICKAPRALWTL